MVNISKLYKNEFHLWESSILQNRSLLNFWLIEVALANWPVKINSLPQQPLRLFYNRLWNLKTMTGLVKYIIFTAVVNTILNFLLELRQLFRNLSVVLDGCYRISFNFSIDLYHSFKSVERISMPFILYKFSFHFFVFFICKLFLVILYVKS